MELMKKEDKSVLLIFISLLCINGVLMSGMNSDTLRFMGYWISMAMGIIYTKEIWGGLIAAGN